jgi:CHAT domain
MNRCLCRKPKWRKITNEPVDSCRDGAGAGAGAEAASGLGRAFFYAGTRALLVTNWPVDSRAARLLTTLAAVRDHVCESFRVRFEALLRLESPRRRADFISPWPDRAGDV